MLFVGILRHFHVKRRKYEIERIQFTPYKRFKSHIIHKLLAALGKCSDGIGFQFTYKIYKCLYEDIRIICIRHDEYEKKKLYFKL